MKGRVVAGSMLQNLCVIGCMAVVFFQPCTGITIAKKILQQNLEVYQCEDEDWSSNRLSEFLAHVIESQSNLSEFSLRRIAFLMLDRYVTRNNLDQSDVLSDSLVWKNLNLFCGEKNLSLFLADKIDRTYTVFGKVMLYDMLAQPRANIEEIKKTQAAIHELVDNTELYNALIHELTEFKKSQSMLVSFWTHDPFRQATQRRYFNCSPKWLTNLLNNSATSLNVRLFFDHAGRCLLNAGGATVAAALLPCCGMSLISSSELSDAARLVTQSLIGYGGAAFGFVARFITHKKFLGCLSVGSGVVCGLSVKESAEWAIDNFMIEVYMHRKMRHVVNAVRRLKNIEKLMANSCCLSDIFSNTNSLRMLFSDKISKNLSILLKNFSHADFNKKLSTFTNKGAILVAYRQFCFLKSEFEDALIEFGKIDALVGLASLYKEHEQSAVRYSFVKFETREFPYISFQQFWNPFISADIVVGNSIELGKDDQHRNLIITGPNEGGKSTVLKALTINIIMAQSFGIAPAETAVLTPFDKIITYSNVVDDIGSGNSLFKAQVLRLQDIVDIAYSLPQSKKSFTPFDEMCNGASPKEAEACAYGVAKSMGACLNNMTVIATHHHLLTSLEQETDCYVNYCVGVIKMGDGSLVYPYRLQRGISDQHIAFDILRNQGFSSSILNDAQRILDRNFSD